MIYRVGLLQTPFRKKPYTWTEPAPPVVNTQRDGSRMYVDVDATNPFNAMRLAEKVFSDMIHGRLPVLPDDVEVAS